MDTPQIGNPTERFKDALSAKAVESLTEELIQEATNNTGNQVEELLAA